MTVTAIADGIALYRVFGENDLPLYISISNNFGRRWKQHAKQQPWWDEMRRLTVDEWFASRPEAELAEDAAIKAEKPKYNKRKTEKLRRNKRAAVPAATSVAPKVLTEDEKEAERADRWNKRWALRTLRPEDVAAVLTVIHEDS